MNDLDVVNWGIIGVGDVCEVKSGPAFSKIPGSNLVAVMRRNASKAKDYAKRHNVPHWYSDADELIQSADINAIYIATPPHMHAHYTKLAAAAGKPIYVEKPMARNFKECNEMIRICNASNVKLFTAYYRRCLPNFLKIKSIIDEGVLGEVRYVDLHLTQPLKDVDLPPESSGNWRINPEIAGGGYFYDLASHQLDFLDYLWGPLKNTRGICLNQARKYEAEDIVSGTFTFENGILGQGLWCFTTSEISSKDQAVIAGTKGEVRFSYFGDTNVYLYIENQKIETFTFEMPAHVHQPLLETVVKDLQGKGICPSTGISGARTNKVMEDLCQWVPL
ncbi:Gfo/Idh/MocA family protein [Membranihabitans maritimus]|uniref:Gfo/Idh/MocA family protein n=1 Tax=Membranihabitans maritimus TaxID=2904244 RepID=UPI001F2D66D4|nr:Gfo/Idh/MocA family oxidoreductase [Membranihabitans maritimus]